jgi:ketosteroid isomerase-like protein
MTITSADAETVRRFYAALAARDFATVESCFVPDAMWHLPGQEPDRWRPSRLARDP